MARADADTINVDKMIGTKIHELRITSGLSRQQLAAQIGVTHQQLQKYEKATNRISPGRLVKIANALGKTVAYFFEDMQEQKTLPSQHQRMCIEVSRNFMKIKDSTHQVAINLLTRTLAGA